MNQNKYLSILIRDNYTCQKCHNTKSGQTIHIAHRIKQGKGSINYIRKFVSKHYNIDLSDKYIEQNIINHVDNMVTVDSLECNSSFNIFNNPVKRDALLEQILKKVLTKQIK